MELDRRYQRSPFYQAEWLDRTNGPAYDTLYLREVEGRSANLFIYPLGGVSSGYTKVSLDTNLFHAGILPPPHRMFVDEIKCVFTKGGEIVHARSSWYWNTLFRFSICQRTMREGHLDTVVDPIALFADDAERKSMIERNICGLLARKLGIPILIEQQQPFSFEVWFGDGLDMKDAPDALRVYLDGFRYRPIQ